MLIDQERREIRRNARSAMAKSMCVFSKTPHMSCLTYSVRIKVRAMFALTGHLTAIIVSCIMRVTIASGSQASSPFL